MHTSQPALCLLACALAANSAHADWQVWTKTETIRVLRDAPAEEGRPAAIAAARNEWESFQILVRSDAAVRGINVVAGDLRGPGGALIRGADARLFRQHQFLLDVPTYRNKSFKPGWYPDALIPFRHPLTRQPLGQARLKAVPFDLPANATHGFWVDVFVPADAKAGEYRCTYRVTAEGRAAVEIPVSLTVWDFALPRVPTLKTALGAPNQRLRGYYARRAKAGKEPAPTDWAAVDAQCWDLVSRHRINAYPDAALVRPVRQADGSWRIPPENIDKLRKFIDTYHVNAIRTDHPRRVVKDPDAEREKLRAWLKAFDVLAAELDRPNVVLYTYLKDEPNDEKAYAYVQKWGRAVKAAHAALKVMVVEQTWTQNKKWGDLYGAIDIWCPLFSLFKAERAAKRQALGETIWTYTALCQGNPTPWWHTDFPLLNYRVPSWIAWRYRIRGLLYWGGMVFWRQVDDPWTDPKTLDRRKRNPKTLYNGEGSILYPGRAVGYDGIASSLRLKALRDGIEDYEYLAILERAGLADEAQKVVMPLAGSWFKWETDASQYDSARAKLAEMIVAAKPSSAAQDGRRQP